MKKSLSFGLLLILGNVAQAQEPFSTPADRVTVLEHNRLTGTQPLYVIKQGTKSFETLNELSASNKTVLGDIDPDWIESIEVLKSEKAQEAFGEKASAGVVIIVLKEKIPANVLRSLNEKFNPQENTSVTIKTIVLGNNKPLFVIHLGDKSFETREEDHTINSAFLKYLNPNWIESVEVFKDKRATQAFGEKGYAGVVVVKLKTEFAEKIPTELSKRFE